MAISAPAQLPLIDLTGASSGFGAPTGRAGGEIGAEAVDPALRQRRTAFGRVCDRDQPRPPPGVLRRVTLQRVYGDPSRQKVRRERVVDLVHAWHRGTPMRNGALWGLVGLGGHAR